MRRIGRWFAVKMVGADVVGVVGLPNFPRTSAEFPPMAPAQQRPTCRHLSSSSVPGGKRKNHLPRPSLCRFVHSITQQDVTIPKFHSGINFSKKLGHLGREKHNAPTRPPLPFKVNAGPQSNVVSCLPAPRPRLEIIWAQG